MVPVLVATLSIQLPANALGKTAEDGPCASAPSTHMDEWDEALGS